MIECKTYRTRPHEEGMRDGTYRSAEEIEAWKRRDPIDLYRKWLIENGHMNRQDLDAVDAEVKAEVDDAVQFAENSPWPEPSTSAKHVYREK